MYRNDDTLGASTLRIIRSKSAFGATGTNLHNKYQSAVHNKYISYPAEFISTEPSGYWPTTSLHLAYENVHE